MLNVIDSSTKGFLEIPSVVLVEQERSLSFTYGRPGGGHFHSKVIGMLVVFLGYKILILVFFRVSWKIFGKWKRFFQKQPSKLQFGYF